METFYPPKTCLHPGCGENAVLKYCEKHAREVYSGFHVDPTMATRAIYIYEHNCKPGDTISAMQKALQEFVNNNHLVQEKP